MLRGRLSAPGSVVALGAGLAFAWTAFATKLITDVVSSGTLSALLLWIPGAAAFALIGVLSEASALQKRPATQVVPSIYVVELVVPVVLAVLVAGERPSSPAAAAGLVACLVLLAASVVVLARSRSLAGLVGR